MPVTVADKRDRALNETVRVWRELYPDRQGVLLALMLIVDRTSEWAYAYPVELARWAHKLAATEKADQDVTQWCWDAVDWDIPGLDQAVTEQAVDVAFWNAPTTLDYFHAITRVRGMMDTYSPAWFTDQGSNNG